MSRWTLIATVTCTTRPACTLERVPAGKTVEYAGRVYRAGQFLPRAYSAPAVVVVPTPAPVAIPMPAAAQVTAPPGIRIVITSQYGTLSRGRHSARQGNGSSAVWAAKTPRGNLLITEAGTWHLHCSDGFSRSARAVIEVSEDGDWTMSGDTRRFDVL